MNPLNSYLYHKIDGIDHNGQGQNLNAFKNLQGWLMALEKAQYETNMNFKSIVSAGSRTNLSISRENKLINSNQVTSGNIEEQDIHKKVSDYQINEKKIIVDAELRGFSKFTTNAETMKHNISYSRAEVRDGGYFSEKIVIESKNTKLHYVPQQQFLPYSVKLVNTKDGIKVWVRDFRQVGMGDKLLNRLREAFTLTGVDLSYLMVNGEQVFSKQGKEQADRINSDNLSTFDQTF